ncbi:hypothetical protein [Streptomyces sp. NPDC051677]|uniref:hypothetical protein n=1 Tax=Streptomyces sp. NPDC051677 TaxID=3365669 RepID=UPI0037D779D8
MERYTSQNGYRSLTVTDVWSVCEELIAIEVDGHVPSRVALAAANLYAREMWGYLSLARESRDAKGCITYDVTDCRWTYVHTVVCLKKRCWCEGFGHDEGSPVPLAGSRPVTRISIY